MKRKRYYVGHLRDERRNEIFASATTPTAEDYPQYGFSTGPFRTKRGAVWASQFGAWYYTIAQAERSALAEAAKEAVRAILGG